MSREPALPSETDIVVVGGGVMGTSTAYFLATETDRAVTLLERDHIAAGSTGDSSAILRHHYGDQEIYTTMAWWSHRFYRSFEDRTEEPLARADNPMVRFGKAGTPEGRYADAGYDVLSSNDIPASRYETDELPEQYPMLVDLDRFDFAVSDDAAGYADGTDAASGFARAARRNGARIVTGTAVEALHVTDGSIAGVATEAGVVDADAVVVAAGPWTPALASTVGLDVPLTVTREQVLVLDPPADFADEYPDLTPTTALPGGEWYVRPDFGDGILVATHHTGDEVDPDTYDPSPDRDVVLDLTESLTDLVPGLANARVKGRYCGVYSSTPDRDFVIDQAGPDGCYLACGFSGHGFKHAPAVGRLVTDLVVTGDSDLADLDFFSLDRFDDGGGHGRPADNV